VRGGPGRLARWLLAALFVLVIALTSLAANVAPTGALDSLAHAGAYAGFAAALLWASDVPGAASYPRRAVVVILAATALGLLMELAQGHVHRDEDLLDVIMDVLGAGIAAIAFGVWSALRRRRSWSVLTGVASSAPK
jgi:VanZ family protein